MSFTEFSKRFLGHVACAALVWIILALAIERLMPGFVAPFVNLPYIGLATIILIMIGIVVGISQSSSRLIRIFGIFIIALACVFSGFFVWSRINTFGISGFILFISFILLVSLAIIAIAAGESKT